MTLNSSGAISLAGATAGQSIAVELGLGTTTQISLNDTAVRTLAGVPSGAITMPTNFYGKSNRAVISYTFTSSTANASLNVAGISGYRAGVSDITVTVNSGIYLYATTNTSTYGLNLSGGTTGDTVILVNNGYIAGKGGTGGFVASGAAGGPALNVGIGVNITINNTNASAYIGGGGGGGGSGTSSSRSPGGGGGGGGGGTGGGGTSGPFGGSVSGGSGGGAGATGSNGGLFTVCRGCCAGACYMTGGGGGGRVFAGSGGSLVRAGSVGLGGGSGGGGGATAGGQNCCGVWFGCGGAGGSANAAGSNAVGVGPPFTAPGSYAFAGGGGGGWGASGGSSPGSFGTSGGAGGKAVNLNGKTVTWTSGNTTRVYGAVS